MLKICAFENCTNRSVSLYCKREHDHLNTKKERLLKPRTPVNKVSDKEKVRQQQYRKQRIQFLKDNPVCKAKLEGCTHEATQVHHMEGRLGELLLNQSKWLPICHNCHEWATENSREAIEKGISLSRLNKAS